jgi:hypothetical protein
MLSTDPDGPLQARPDFLFMPPASGGRQYDHVLERLGISSVRLEEAAFVSSLWY